MAFFTVQAERDSYLREELAATEQNARSLAEQAAAAEKEVAAQTGACEAAAAALQELRGSKGGLEELCREKGAAYSEANKLHNELLDQCAFAAHNVPLWQHAASTCKLGAVLVLVFSCAHAVVQLAPHVGPNQQFYQPSPPCCSPQCWLVLTCTRSHAPC